MYRLYLRIFMFNIKWSYVQQIVLQLSNSLLTKYNFV